MGKNNTMWGLPDGHERQEVVQKPPVLGLYVPEKKELRFCKKTRKMVDKEERREGGKRKRRDRKGRPNTQTTRYPQYWDCMFLEKTVD